ncbi:MAG: 50S ribosomal protein L21 [Candidatus Marinimicrobia bacterium]|nr:50S ribosomal protein L21 [Candidatus Neomarinimicrobiota bacterium]
MYAIINISGKQYKAIVGARIRVPKQEGEPGTLLTFDKVLLINNGENTEIGNPVLRGSSVTGKIVEHGRDKKILVYKKKRRKGYQRKNGHRQWFTEIEFNTIEVGNSQSSQVKTISTEAVMEEEE